MSSVRILVGDCRTTLGTLPDHSVQTCVTSPPYFGLRDYGHAEQIGLEQTPDAFVAQLVAVFREVKRVLRDDGTLWLNIGDSYSTHAAGVVDNPMAKSTLNAGGKNTAREANRVASTVPTLVKRGGLPEKNLIGIPWMLAFALRADGWILRQDIIWAKPNPMPEPVFDRCVKSHEHIFLLTKRPSYCFDSRAIRSETANKKDVWFVPVQSFQGAHFATFPPALIEPCILAGCPEGGVVLDPFGGAGTTGLVADRLGREAILCELNPTFARMAADRIRGENPMFTQVSLDTFDTPPYT